MIPIDKYLNDNLVYIRVDAIFVTYRMISVVNQGNVTMQRNRILPNDPFTSNERSYSLNFTKRCSSIDPFSVLIMFELL